MGDGMGLGLADEEVERVGFQMRQGNATKFQLDGEGQNRRLYRKLPAKLRGRQFITSSLDGDKL